MPVFNNPALKDFVEQRTPLYGSPFRSQGLVAPIPDVYRFPGTVAGNPMYRFGDALGGAVEDRKLLEPVGRYAQALSSTAGPGRAMLLTALLGGVVGAGMGLGTRRDPLTWGLLGAGTGALSGLGINQLLRGREIRRQMRDRQWRKSAYYVLNEQDPMAYIQARLFEDRSISSGEKAQIVTQLRNVPRNELFTLADMLRTAAGASVGYIIGRFLMRFGGIGTSVMTGLGGLIGARSGRNRIPKNMMGLEVDTSRDMFGRPRLVF